MAEYYLMSQLPSLDSLSEATPMPISEEQFLELCSRFLNKKAQVELSNLSLAPSRDGEVSTSALIRAWNEGERNLRLALAKIRAEKMKKQLELGEFRLSTELIKIANVAVEMENPMEAESFLNRYRLDFLESLRPMDCFAEDSVFYYGLKLKLILRMRKFNTEHGETAYKKIYTSIINGDELEAKQ